MLKIISEYSLWYLEFHLLHESRITDQGIDIIQEIVRW